ncbi:MAG: pilin [Patescibacteria group bacterium]
MKLMKIINKPIFLLIFVVVAVFFGVPAHRTNAAACLLNNATWRQPAANTGDVVEVKIDGNNDCLGQKVTIEIWWDQMFPTPDTRRATVEAVFPSNSSTIIYKWTVPSDTSWTAFIDAQFYIIAKTNSSGAGASVDSTTNGSIPYLKITSITNLNPEVQITDFHVTPKEIPANKTSTITATLKFHANSPAYLVHRCVTGVQLFLLDDSGSKIYSSAVKALDQFTSDYNFDFNYNYDAKGDGTVNLRGKIECWGNSLLVTLPTSSPVPLKIGSGGTGTGPGGGTVIPGTATKSYSFNITNPLKGGPNDLFDIINIVTQWIIYIAVPLAVLWIMYAGFLMLTAGPKPENFKKGKDILWYTILGLAIIFIGKGFVTLIISIIQLGGTS